MKKMLIFVLIVSIFSLFFAGCSGTVAEAPDNSPSPTSQTVSQPSTSDPSQDPDTADDSTTAPSSKPEPEPQDLESFYSADGSFDLQGACESLGYELVSSRYDKSTSPATYEIKFRNPDNNDELAFPGVLNSWFVAMEFYIRSGDNATLCNSALWFCEEMYQGQNLYDFDALAVARSIPSTNIVVFTTEDGNQVTFPEGTIPNLIKALEKSVDGTRENPFSAMDYGAYWEGEYTVVDSKYLPNANTDENVRRNFYSERRTQIE